MDQVMLDQPVIQDPLGQDPWTMPLELYDPGNPTLFLHDAHWPYFERLRREAPVHYSTTNEWGPYWSITKFRHITQIEANHEVFSSDVTHGGITLRDQLEDFILPMFIAMDPPIHDFQRAAVQPIVGPESLAKLEVLIRERATSILDNLPIDEPFNWVKRVSIELTTQMLATLFDYPFEKRRDLTHWSNVATANPRDPNPLVRSEEERFNELKKMAAAMTGLWNERVNKPGGSDLISMLAHGEATRNMDPMEFMGNCVLLIVGGNDTTRNSISGGLWALNQHPAEYQKLRDNPGLIPNMVPEIIRWQTPLAYMRRTALSDYELGGKTIRAGDKLAMWYISGNRDPEAIEEPDRFIIDRTRPRQHLSFGFGIHRCVGNRLAELQLTILWEEIMKRFPVIEVVEEPKRVFSTFVHGIASMLVRIPG